MPQSNCSITPAVPIIKPVSLAVLRALFIVLAMLGLSLPVTAVTVDGLYNVEVPVDGSGPAQLKAGYAEGLSRVFLRVSGSSGVLKQSEVQALLQDAEKLLQSYQYLGAEDSGSSRLRMTFGAVGVNKALASVAAPVWGTNRPLTLAWVAVQDNRGRQLLVNPAGEAGNEWQQAFSEAATRRGVPVALPPADLAGDEQLLSEVWGQFMDSIRDASSGQNHDLLATARINREGNEWRASWHLEGRGIDDIESSVRGANPDDVANRIVDAWADMLGSTYAVAAGDVSDSAQVDIVIEGVRSLADYAAINISLGNMTPVVWASAVKANGAGTTIRVALSGELSQLQEYMALDQRFQHVAAPAISTTEQIADEPETGSTEEEAVVTDAVSSQDAAADNNDATSFESLYPVLHYRWRSGSNLKQGAGG